MGIKCAITIVSAGLVSGAAIHYHWWNWFISNFEACGVWFAGISALASACFLYLIEKKNNKDNELNRLISDFKKELQCCCMFYLAAHYIVNEKVTEINDRKLNIFEEYSHQAKNHYINSTIKKIGYENTFVSINYQFKRYLICPKCNKRHSLESLRVKFRNYKYIGKCKKCNFSYWIIS